MKKMMLMVGVLMAAVAMFAVGKPAWVGSYQPAYAKMLLEADYVGARAYVDSFDFSAAQITRNNWVSFQLVLDMKEGKKYTGIESIKTRVNSYATQVGLTDTAMIDADIQQQAYNGLESKRVAYDFFKTVQNPPSDAMKIMHANTCVALKEYNEALSIYLALGNYLAASQITAVNLKDKVKTFEYGRKAMLDQYLAAPVLVTVIDRVFGFDYSDTTVTKDQIIELGKALDLKYRRFLIKDTQAKAANPAAIPIWEPIIAGIRLTLQGYGVEVK